MNSLIEKKINQWLDFKDLDNELRKEIEKSSLDSLYEAFYTDLEFGTGGMRGIIGAGTNRMNIYTIRNANYGYAQYLLRESKNPSCVIAYDNRYKSKEFALESALVLANHGIKVYLFDEIAPTPQLSFAVRFLKTTGGIVITASHNPPNYNGYKIYDCFGCQLVPELADYVINEIKKAPNPFTVKMPTYDEFLTSSKIEIIKDELDQEYLNCVKSITCLDVDKTNFKATFSALHGTSARLGIKLLKQTNYNIVRVEEQLIHDPDFTTVKSPNPEDPKAFDLSIKYAQKYNADICVATDPDADRIGVAILHEENFHLLNGNQTGAILINYLTKFKKMTKKGILFNTIVTSTLGAQIALKHNIDVKSTLTGFKFIGEQAKLLENDNNSQFFFGYEESYGYVIDDFVRDKDSLQALLLICEVACFYKNQGKTLLDVLEDIYKDYGYYQDSLVNITLEGSQGLATINKILTHFRNLDYIEGLDFIIKEDYLKRKRFSKNKEEDLILPESNVLKFYLDNNNWFVLRPSGTEPKMKIYISTVSKVKEESLLLNQKIKKIILDIVERIKNEK